MESREFVQLHVAARVNDRTLLRTLLREGYNKRHLDAKGYSPLHVASAEGNIDCVRELLSTFASGSTSDLVEYVNMQTFDGCTALFLAASKGFGDIVRLLRHARANVNLMDRKGVSPLHKAVLEDNVDMVKLLIKKGANANAKDPTGRTCLHLAAEKGFTKMVCTLVPLCHVDARDDKEKTALFLASSKGQMQCLVILADAGACTNVHSSKWKTPLMVATKNNHEACVEALLRCGADPNLVCSRLWPRLPIHVAARSGNIQILRRLIAVTDRAIDRTEGMVSPLYEAINGDDPESLEVLLDEGFSPNGQNCKDVYDVDSPLALALSPPEFEDFDELSEPARRLLAAGAHVSEDAWEVLLQNQVCLSELLEQKHLSKEDQRRPLLEPEEQKTLQATALTNCFFSDCWLPSFLEAGLDPSVFFNPDLVQDFPTDVLNYLLELVNWSTLPPPIKDALDQRAKQGLWTPLTHHKEIPSLFHLCRLEVRAMLGPRMLMKSDAVQQLPVPQLLHEYLRFEDVESPCPI